MKQKVKHGEDITHRISDILHVALWLVVTKKKII